MVANGIAMNKMLRASRAEAKLSLQLAEEMKKDSVAMKTVRSPSNTIRPGMFNADCYYNRLLSSRSSFFPALRLL
jgi:hypothetical protein